MTLVKICGITREDDARFCAGAGVDFVGFVFAAGSPRLVDAPKAAAMVAAMGKARPMTVGVFRNDPVERVREIAARVPLDFVQLHGEESEAEIGAVGLPVIKSVPVGLTIPRDVPTASWILYDTYDPERGGGTGRAFDWTLLAGRPLRRPYFLAGGLTPGNVAEAVRIATPDAVDVSSGVESAPGIKHHGKIARLLAEVRR